MERWKSIATDNSAYLILRAEKHLRMKNHSACEGLEGRWCLWVAFWAENPNKDSYSLTVSAPAAKNDAAEYFNELSRASLPSIPLSRK